MNTKKKKGCCAAWRGLREVERLRFARCREAVSAKEAAERYGMQIDRNGRALCPVHDDHHPSVSFHNGRWHCWSCGAAGDSIDLTGHLLHLTPGQALRRLNADFNLGLCPDSPPTQAELQQALDWERKQVEIRRFVDWREAMLKRLAAAIYAGNEVKKLRRDLTDREALALRQNATLEFFSEELSGGPPEIQHGMYDRREEIERICGEILDEAS